MTSRSDAFKAAQQEGQKRDSRTDRSWAIQDEMERQGFEHDSTKGSPEDEASYSPLKVDIYQSSTNPTKFLSVKAGTTPKGLKVSDNDYASIRKFKEAVDLTDQRVALDRVAAQKAIQEDGYYLHMGFTI
jgi:hypothetical protein